MVRKPGHAALRRGRVSLPGQVYSLMTVTVGRTAFFLDFGAGCAAARCFENVRFLGDAQMLAWVLMPDHTHWLIQPSERDHLATVVNRLKSASARAANRALGRTGTLWERAFYDHALRRDEDVVAWRLHRGQSDPCRFGDEGLRLPILECNLVVGKRLARELLRAGERR